ncbi:F-box associated interaction domain-containing protein [Artemisia annua]|uniref:F-box associated interaction domain-containing protein n=1 Tax=Artemisia annua TaxID=35608 RepID=A0A2U1K8S0_ARTAN|nr:F-box associated interaction domain-containing protein [Artemisia annua]
MNLDPPPDNDVYVYSLRSDTWTKVSNSPFDHYSYDEIFPGVFVNGFLHWIACKDSDYGGDHGVIAAFGLADEKFCEVPSPYFYLYNDVNFLSVKDCKLVALGEKLAIFDHEEGVVWLMNEYGVKESWTKIVVHGFSESRMVEPMIFYDNGKIVFVNGKLEVLNHAEEKCLGKSHDVLWLEGYFSSLQTMASENIITIPHDIITDILHRLPAKSLGQFRCVSKNWRSLLSQPKFIKTHRNILKRNHLIFIYPFDRMPVYSDPVG